MLRALTFSFSFVGLVISGFAAWAVWTLKPVTFGDRIFMALPFVFAALMALALVVKPREQGGDPESLPDLLDVAVAVLKFFIIWTLLIVLVFSGYSAWFGWGSGGEPGFKGWLLVALPSLCVGYIFLTLLARRKA